MTTHICCRNTKSVAFSNHHFRNQVNGAKHVNYIPSSAKARGSMHMHHLVLFSLLLATSTAQQPLSNLTNTLKRPWQKYGIAHYEIPGLTLQQQTNIAHIFLRFLLYNDTQVAVRGFLYLESPENLKTFPTVSGGVMLQQQVPGNLSDALSLVIALTATNTTNRIALLPVTGTPDIRYPLVLNGMFPRKHLAYVKWLIVGDLPRAASLSKLVYTPLQQFVHVNDNTDRQVRFIGYPLWGHSLGPSGMALLRTYVEWHLRMGFAEYVQYAYDAGPYMEDLRIQKWVAEGKMMLLSWRFGDTGFTKPFRANAERYDKPLLYNHAILSHWGSGSYLFIADQDEFLATQQPIENLQTLLHADGCLADTIDQARLRRHDALCMACYKEATTEKQVFMGTGPQGPAGAQGADESVHGGADHTADGGAVRQRMLVEHVEGETAMLSAEKQQVQAEEMIQQAIQSQQRDMQRLSMYTHLSLTDDHTKSLINPDIVQQYHVHNGPKNDVPGARISMRYATLDCVFVVHLKHLFGLRLGYNSVKGAPADFDVASSYVANNTWLWPLQ